MTQGPLMFTRLARFYDLLVGEKDYRAEVRYLEALAQRFGRSDGRAWLDVACGTGRHLEFLRRNYEVTGVDVSAAMLRVARRRLPGIRLLRGDMRALDLHEPFDVVSCLFSAIGHLRTQRELSKAFANFASHLKPGGVAIVEPWIDPSIFTPGYLHVVTKTKGGVSVARMSRSYRQGRHSYVRFHYLIGERGRPVRYFEETDKGLLVPRRRLLELLRGAGLNARFLPHGLTRGRGLLIGQRPVE